ncbi:Protein of unknown function [Tranquillimonas rosea]|uniref:DUF2484 family protein n=1 Tax=Tranquillimonas rosea TaxID=641238 RepID=A0A1H9UZW8_9RHOB|nr:Protein of unknown function [Tranquillimonas rosea]
MALVLACLWCIVANLLAMRPSRRNHWPEAMALIAAGVPILVWVAWAEGMWLGALFFVAGLSVLRWPVRHLGAWLVRTARRR